MCKICLCHTLELWLKRISSNKENRFLLSMPLVMVMIVMMMLEGMMMMMMMMMAVTLLGRERSGSRM